MPDDPISIAAAAIIRVFFMSFISTMRATKPNAHKPRKFAPLKCAKKCAKETVPRFGK